jgi:hypothetical protein
VILEPRFLGEKFKKYNIMKDIKEIYLAHYYKKAD